MQTEAFALLLRRRGVEASADFLDGLRGNSERDVWRALSRRYSLDEDIDNLVDERSREYLMRASQLHAAPYVRPLVDSTGAAGKDSVIVSSARFAHIAPLLENWGLAGRFAAIYCVASPDAPDFPTKKDRLNYVLSHWPPPFLMIEDNPGYLQDAAARGALTVAVQHGLNSVANGPWDFVIDIAMPRA